MGVYIGVVTKIYDDGTERINVNVPTLDNMSSDLDSYYDPKDCRTIAFPLLPKMVHIKPKVGESVVVIVNDESGRKGNRFYIGPIISQVQKMNGEKEFAERVLKYGIGAAYDETVFSADLINSLMKDDEIGIYGRGTSDIVLSDDDIRIRCGALLRGDTDKNKIETNRRSPSFIKLKYHYTPLSFKTETHSDGDVSNTVNVVGEYVNLISTKSINPNIELFKNDGNSLNAEDLDDEQIKKILEKAHQLPYGDVLCDMLYSFITLYANHTHAYSGLPPVYDGTMSNFMNKYGTSNGLKKRLLSKHIRIN